MSTTSMCDSASITPVIPAQAGIQCLWYERRWVPAFAGTTKADCHALSRSTFA